MNMKQLRCLLGFHDWTAWRRAPMSKVGASGTIDVTTLSSEVPAIHPSDRQYRRCRRCGKREQRAKP